VYSFFIRVYFIRISSLKFSVFAKNIMRIFLGLTKKTEKYKSYLMSYI